MPELREELSDCEVGDVVFWNVSPVKLKWGERLMARPRFEPIAMWNETPEVLAFQPVLQFESALATLPDSTAKVRVWRRVS